MKILGISVCKNDPSSCCDYSNNNTIKKRKNVETEKNW